MEGGTNDDMIQKRFGLDIPVFVILQEKLEDILSKAPDWWGTPDKDIYDNLIFVMSPATAEIIAEKIGEPTKELEQICICDNTIFWSFDRNKYCGFGKSRKIIFYAYLADIDLQAEKLFLRLVKQMADAEGITETLKASDQMEWVRQMNSIRNRAMEIVNAELIFA